MRDLRVCPLQKADSRPGQEKTENKDGSTAKTGHYDGSVDPEPGHQDELLRVHKWYGKRSRCDFRTFIKGQQGATEGEEQNGLGPLEHRAEV